MAVMIWLVFTLRQALLGGTPSLEPQGPLAPYRVELASEAPTCRSEGCTVATVRPLPYDAGAGQAIRSLEMPDQWLVAPEGRVFTDAWIGDRRWVTRHDGSAYALSINTADLRGLDRSRELLDTPTPGFVRMARVHGSERLMLLDGRVSDDQVRFVKDPFADGRLIRMYGAVRFQPVARTIELELPQSWLLPPKVGDSMRAQVFLTHQAGSSVETFDLLQAANLGTAVSATVSAVQADEPPWRVQLKLDDDAAQRLLERRAGFEQMRGEPVAVQNVKLQWSANGAMRVAASALVRDQDGLRVWAAIGHRAVPLALHELYRGEQFSIVVEQPGARGMPVRPADWVALGSAGRAGVFRWAAPDGKDAAVVRADLPIIDKPDAALKPGAGVRFWR